MCMLLLVCLPHCVITFVADFKHRGQCSPGSIAVQTSGSTNYRSYSDPIGLWVMLFFSSKSVMKLGLFVHINYTSDHCKIRAWFTLCSMLLILSCKCSGHNNHMVAWRRLCDDLRQACSFTIWAKLISRGLFLCISGYCTKKNLCIHIWRKGMRQKMTLVCPFSCTYFTSDTDFLFCYVCVLLNETSESRIQAKILFGYDSNKLRALIFVFMSTFLVFWTNCVGFFFLLYFNLICFSAANKKIKTAEWCKFHRW